MEKSGLQNAALVLEGGGFRGIYTTGVLDYLMEQGLYLPNVYGVSAGALNALGYAAKQPGRNAQINFRFCSDKRYVSVRNLLHYRSAFNLEFIFDVIPEKYIPFDYETFFSSEVQVHVGATNLLTGKCEFFTKEQMDRRFFPVRASAALPLFSRCSPIPSIWEGHPTLTAVSPARFQSPSRCGTAIKSMWLSSPATPRLSASPPPTCR